jgi:type II secretory pathway pseudopilin PulG
MRQRARNGGFTYLGLIIFVAIIGMVGAATLKVGSLLQRAASEDELLDIGAAFSDALRSYAAATPPGQAQQPPTLQALLRDPRIPGVRRHLRKIFVDPMTGKAEWGLMTLGDKVGIVGVYSLSQAKPLKIGNFDQRFLNFDRKEHISEWKFTATGQGTLAPPASPTAPLVPPPAPGTNPAAPPPMVPPAPVAEPPSAPSEPAQPAAEPEPVPAAPPEPEEDKEKEEQRTEKDETPPPAPPPTLPPMPIPRKR